jgi:CMP-N-acetylneuraminic acid synthetase
MLGIPLITRAIAICQDSHVFADILVSTDSPEIARLASDSGATVVQRPHELADHHTPLLPVVAHSVDGFEPATPVCCVYATAVTLSPQDLTDSWGQFSNMLKKDQLLDTFLTGIVEFPHPIQRALVLDGSGAISMLHPEFAHTRTQDLLPRWHDAGAFIWGTVQSWIQSESVFSRAHGFPLPHSRIVDIDTEDDWIVAERVLSARIEQSRIQQP